MRRVRSEIFGLVFLVFISGKAFAFPEMVTHGYTNCTACHVSPTGGGLMTEYGRNLSSELLSTWSHEGEEKVLYGAVRPPQWLITGGDVRTIQTYLNNAQTRRGSFFLMQAEVGLAVKVDKWTAAATGGVKGGPSSVKDRNDAVSRVHYLMYQPGDTTAIRVGRFMPQFGINEPNHTVVTRRGLGFDEDMESYNAELSYTGENADLFLTGIFGRPDDKHLHHETGFSATSSYNFFEKNKIGVNVYNGKNNDQERWLGGLSGIFALPYKFFLLSEIDHQWQRTLAAHTSTGGFVSYQRLGYEPLKGVQVYGIHQLSYLDINSVNTRLDAYGPGFDFFPRPHLEFRAEYLRERVQALSRQYFDTGWFLLHYYF